MIKFIAARRGPLVLIVLYVAGLLFFIAQEMFAWVDANAQQDSTREALRVLMTHAAQKGPVAGSGNAQSFVAESETQAIASFDALMRNTIATLGGVVVSSRSEQANETSGENSIMISAIFQGDIAVVQSALYRLEMGSPAIFIDHVLMEPQTTEASSDNPLLRVSLSLSSRWSTTR